MRTTWSRAPRLIGVIFFFFLLITLFLIFAYTYRRYGTTYFVLRIFQLTKKIIGDGSAMIGMNETKGVETATLGISSTRTSVARQIRLH